MDWDIQIGDVTKRRAVHALFGGQQQQGISTPARSDNILVFTDPAKGARYGYDLHEGAREDGIYAYTGEGQVGPQRLARGNLALANSARNGKVIRLFRTKGADATYVGAFTLDDPPFEWRDIPDEAGDIRRGIIFGLAPLDANLALVPPLGRERTSQIESYVWNEPASDNYSLSPVIQPERSASRIEFELQSDFGSWRRAMGHDLQRKRIPVGASFVEPDLFDATTSELFEAKKSAARKYVRAAIGQVLDYAHNANRLGLTARPAILLPSSPDHDLLSLCETLGITVYARFESTFSKLTTRP